MTRPEAPAPSVYAHSLPGKPVEAWEPLSHHLAAVGRRAAESAAPFGWSEMARLAGRLHDVGKLTAEFQAYIRGERLSGSDHSSAGARIAYAAYPGLAGKLLAAIIAGHHAGLADGPDLERRMSAFADKVPGGWEALTDPLPTAAAKLLSAHPLAPGMAKGFGSSFLIRMLFSCLVDADFLETERFYAEARREAIERGGHLGLAVLRDRLNAAMARLRVGAEPSEVNALRNEILDHAIAKAALPPGLFTLTVPTGGGKTLASLSFALEHALRHGLRRVIYVIPFTSIIEQTSHGRACGSTA